MRSLLFLRRVVGHSMVPTLKPGNLVIASRLLSVKTGRIVIARAGNTEVIKRVGLVKSYYIQLIGDNKSSAHNIEVKPTDILGVVVHKRK